MLHYPFGESFTLLMPRTLGTFKARIHTDGGTAAMSEYAVPKKNDKKKKSKTNWELFDPDVHKPASKWRIELHPESGKIQRLVEGHVYEHIREMFAKIRYSTANKMHDSARYTSQHLMKNSSDIRKLLSKLGDDESLAVFTGTDNVAAKTFILAESISPEELGDRNIFVCVSPDHVSHANPAKRDHPVIKTLNTALCAAQHDKFKTGRIVICDQDYVISARGAHKPSTEALLSRFQYAAVEDDTLPQFGLSVSPPAHAERPRGVKGVDYKLSTGISKITLGPADDYVTVLQQVDGMLHPSKHLKEVAGKRATERRVSGVLLLPPGEANLFEEKSQLAYLERAAEIAYAQGVPVGIVGDPVKPDRNDSRPANGQQVVYGASFKASMDVFAELSSAKVSYLLDMTEFTRAEAEMLMAAATAQAEELGYYAGHVIDYVEAYLNQYRVFLKTGEGRSSGEVEI